jgi:hypothetical protein
MTIDTLAALTCALLCAGCPLRAPPDPEPIVCDEIERAEERFPDECTDAGANEDSDGEVDPSDDD